MATGLIDAPVVEEPQAPQAPTKTKGGLIAQPLLTTPAVPEPSPAPIINAPAVEEPKASTQVKGLINAPVIEEPQKPLVETKTGAEGIPETPKPVVDPDVAEKKANLALAKQAEIEALVSPETPEDVKAYESKKQEIENRYGQQQAALTPPPQAAGGVPTAEDLATRIPHLAQPETDLSKVPALGGAPTPEELATRTPHLAEGYTPQQMEKMTQQEEQRQLAAERDITSRATPNLSAQQLGESYGASAAAVAGAPPSFPTQAQQQAADVAKVAQQQAEEDKQSAPPEAVTSGTVTEQGVRNYEYSYDARVQSLINKFGNADALTNSYAKLSPEDKKEFGPLYNDAITKLLQWNIDHPNEAAAKSVLRGIGDTANTIVGTVKGALSLPSLLPQLAAAGITSVQALDVLGAVAQHQQLTPQQQGVLRTISASLQLGHHETAQMLEDLINTYMQLQNRETGQKSDNPDQMSWEQIGQMSPVERKRYTQGRMDSLANRFLTEKKMGEGALTDVSRANVKATTGVDLMSLDDLAKKNIHVNPEAIQGGAFLTNMGELMPLFAGGEALGLDGLISKSVGRATEASGELMSGVSRFHAKYIEPQLPKLGRAAGEQVGKSVTKGIVTGVTGGMGAGIPSMFYPKKWNPLVKAGGYLGEKIGGVPKMMRERWWDPMSRVLIDHGAELQDPVANAGQTLALHGPAGAMIRPVTAGIKGAVYSLPFLAGPKTAEERGQILGMGAGLMSMHAAPEAARDAAMSSLFFRDPAKYKPMGFGAMDYGTDYFGQNFDAAHNAFVNTQSALDQARINDSRGLLPNVEQYHLGNSDYQAAVAHLQANGMLPAGNLQSRGFNILTDPATGKALILVNGDAPGGLHTAAHEIGHTIYRTLSPEQQDAFKNTAFSVNDPNQLAQWYFGNLTGRNISYMDLPDEAGIANGTQGYLPGLDGYTKEHFVEEMGAETVAALLRGQPLSSFVRNPALMRRVQLALGAVMEKMGIKMTPAEATTILGVRPGVAQMWILDKALRDYFKKNPVAQRPTPAPAPPGGGGGRQGPIPKPKGRQTAATPKPTGGPAPVPPPTPPGGPKAPPSVGPKAEPKVTNNQPEIGGGPTGAPQSEIDDAVKGLQALQFPKRQAQQMVKNASGQTAAELLRNALKNHQVAQGRIEVRRAPQEAVQAQAPQMPHPLAAHRDLTSPALLRRAIDGDPQAVQALVERHGANWLKEFEKGGAHEGSRAFAAEYRRKYPEQAAEQDQRVKAGVEAKPERAETDAERAYREKYGTKAEPKVDLNAPPHEAIAARAYELSQERGGAPGHEQEDWAQAEKELRQRAIDAVKARFQGRAAFMPMAGERAQMFPDEESAGRTFVSPLHGKKQFEIDDRDLTFVPPPKGSPDKTMLEHNWGDYVNNPGGTSRLGDIINHPDLFKNYPDLRNLTVEMRPEIRARGAYQPADFDYVGEPEKILLQSVNRETLAHEIQHAVQYRENGWPRGDNPTRIAREMMKDPAIEQDLTSLFNAHYPELGPPDFKTGQAYFDYMADRIEQWDQWYRDKIRRMASGAYLMSPGEVEARAVGKRAVAPSGWRIKPEEQLALEQGETKARVEKEFERMQHPPMGTQAAFMPDIPEEVRLRGAGAEKGKEQVRLRYDGAPPGVTDARSLRKLKDQLTQMANEGAAFRHWYTEGAEPMMRGVGNDPRRFEQLMANIAATSPQNRVYPNFGMAVRGLAQQEAGGRKITVGKGEQMKQRLSEIGQGNIWQGVKINQFYRDHMAVFDKRLADDMGSTMDMHMARAFGYPTDSFTPKQSQWSQGIMREITSDLGWGKPKETQAAIWSAIKARFETVWPEIYADAKASGDIITKVTKGGAEKSAFKDAATELKYRNRALKAAMQIPPPDLSEAAFNFGDALRRDLGAISYETRPSSVIQEKNPWMKQMTPEDWDEYHRQQANVLLDPDGTNKLAKLTNLISIGEHQGYSAWGTERNLSQQISAVMPKAAGVVLERAGQKWKVDPTIEKQVRDFAAAVGLLYQQDGVGYHRPYFDAGATHKESNGVRINAGRSFTSEETQAVVASLEKLLPSFEQDGAKGWFVAPEENGLRVVSWGHDDGKKIYNLVEKAVNDTLPESSTPTLERFASYGNLISNNWEENSNGEMYRRWLGARRRSDVQRLVDDTLRPQVQAIDDQWRIRKSGETEGGQRAASPEEIGQEEPPSTPKAAAMLDVPAYPKRQQPILPAMRFPPSVSQAQEEERKRQTGIPSDVTMLATPPETEVRRGEMMMPRQRPSQPASQTAQPPQQQPSEEGDQTGVADFFRKRGDPPITSSDDPRLTTVTVGGQSWRVNKEAAPAFQGFLNELAAAGAPIRSDGGWVYRQKVGASGISEHAFGGAIDLNQEGRNEVTPAFQAWLSSHPGALAQAENRWHIYGGERFGDLGHFEWGGIPSQRTAASQEAKRRAGLQSAARIMREEGSSDVQDGVPEVFGFRKGQDSEYDELARLRGSGDEQGVQRLAVQGLIKRAIDAGSGHFDDPAIKSQIMSLAHMRGPSGARTILNAVGGSGHLVAESSPSLDPQAIEAIRHMSREEFMRRIQIARTVYDQKFHGQEYWNRFGKGLAGRYAREREFYASLQ